MSKHRLTVLQWTPLSSPRWAAACDCGWVGNEAADPHSAVKEYGAHIPRPKPTGGLPGVTTVLEDRSHTLSDESNEHDRPTA